jgi:Glycosyltransferase family 87
MPYVPYFGLVVWGCAAIWLIHHHRDRLSRVIFLAFAMFAVAFLAVKSTGRGTPFGDFDKAYYPAGRDIFSEPSRVYDCAHEDRLCFVNLPLVAMFFAPVAALPLSAAHAVVAAASLASIAVTAWLLVQLVGARGTQRYAVVALILLNGPLYYSVRLANITHIVLLFLVIAVAWMIRGQGGRAGSLLALVALLKPPFLIWLPYFALRRQWRAAAAMTLTLTLLAVTSLMLFGVPLHMAWIRHFLVGSSAHPIGAYNVQSIAGFLVRLSISGTLVDWRPVDVGRLFFIAQVALTLAVVVAGLAAGALAGQPRDRTAQLREYSMVLCVMLLASPVSWTHYYSLLLLPLAAFASGAMEPPPARWLRFSTAIAALLVSLPVMLWVPADRFAGALIARVLLSHYVFGAVLLLGILIAASIEERYTLGRFARWRSETSVAAVVGYAKGA